uniref:Uncharacterized protein n=1 Tax=Panagrolaimus sp. ES5 TaxID=591445 RepID=A0AC34GBU3_9BILA
MTEERRCFFNVHRLSVKEAKERTAESLVSVELVSGGNLMSFQKLFEKESNYSDLSIAKIILARGAAEFEVTESEYENAMICEFHEEELYSKWEKQSQNHIIVGRTSKSSRKSVCSFPSGYGINHGRFRPFTTGHIISFDNAKNFLNQEKLLLHVGLPICQEHKKYVELLQDGSTSTSTTSSQSSEYRSNETKKTIQKPEPIVTEEVAKAVTHFAKVAGILFNYKKYFIKGGG